MSYFYSTIIIASFISTNIQACQAHEGHVENLESLYDAIESKGFAHATLNETVEELAYYRNLCLGSSTLIGIQALRGAEISKDLDFGLSPWILSVSGLCISSLLTGIITKLERHDRGTHELPVIDCLKKLNHQEQDRLIHMVQEKNFAISTRCIATVSVINWLRTCQQKAIKSSLSLAQQHL